MKSHCGRYNIPSSVLILTLDNLRDINAEHGMRMGDKLLKILGSILLSESRKADIPCRIGAKQLAVIMSNTGEAAALEAKERVNIKIASECAARDIANLSLTLDVRSGTWENFSALLSIPGVNKPQESEFRKLRSMAGNLFSLLNEEKQTMERRQHYRKSVRLAGRYGTWTPATTGSRPTRCWGRCSRSWTPSGFMRQPMRRRNVFPCWASAAACSS